jgi:hypothetical protein
VEIPDSEADKIDSCKAAIDYIAALPKAKWTEKDRLQNVSEHNFDICIMG